MTSRSLKSIQRYPPLKDTINSETIIEEVLVQLPSIIHSHDNLPLLDSLTIVDDRLNIDNKPVPGLLITNDW